MNARTIIFIGSQGSGKGTQADLLKAALEKSSPNFAVMKHDTGASFRAFCKEHPGNYTVKMVEESLNKGNLQPSFLPIYLWTKDFIDHLRGEKTHVVIDGSPRTTLQADTLDEALTFYGRENVSVIYLVLSPDLSVKRLLLRGRADDTEVSIRRRLALYEKQTKPILDYFKSHPRYDILEINGDQTVEAIHAEIKQKLALP